MNLIAWLPNPKQYLFLYLSPKPRYLLLLEMIFDLSHMWRLLLGNSLVSNIISKGTLLDFRISYFYPSTKYIVNWRNDKSMVTPWNNIKESACKNIFLFRSQCAKSCRILTFIYIPIGTHKTTVTHGWSLEPLL